MIDSQLAFASKQPKIYEGNEVLPSYKKRVGFLGYKESL